MRISRQGLALTALTALLAVTTYELRPQRQVLRQRVEPDAAVKAAYLAMRQHFELRKSPARETPPKLLTVMTLNVGLSPSVPHLAARKIAMNPVVERLIDAFNVDVFFFQELWEADSVASLRKLFKARGYSFVSPLPSGTLGAMTGLQIAVRDSRLKPIRASFEAFEPSSVALGWFVEARDLRGSLVGRFELDDSLRVTLMNTHLTSGIANLVRRRIQSQVFGERLRGELNKSADVVIAGADMNASPDFADAVRGEVPDWRENGLVLADLLSKSRFFDLFAVLHPTDAGWTQERERNLLARTGSGTEYEPEQRIDYIFFGDTKNQLKPLQASVVVDELMIEGTELPIGDHHGLLGTFAY